MMLLVGNGSGDGGGNSGGVTAVAATSNVLGVQDPVLVPMDGVLEEPGPSSRQQFHTFINLKYPDAAWDPHLLAQVVLAEFGTCKWQESINIPEPPRDRDEVVGEIDTLLELRSLRPSRLPEILAQAQNLEMYWADLLMVKPLGRPNTATLIAIGIAVGHMVGMHFKHKFKRPRPVQVFPPLMPVILTPAHPSYPSNHSFQSHLIALALHSIFEEEKVANAMYPQLFAMAARIAKGREIAGVHFPSDTEAGKELAKKTFECLQRVKSFEDIRKAAKDEWKGIGVGPRPQHVGLMYEPG